MVKCLSTVQLVVCSLVSLQVVYQVVVLIMYQDLNTGSDGSIIDLGLPQQMKGETVFLTTGDGVVVDSNNYWYTTGHFKIGDGQKQIEWNTTDLNISGSPP